MFTKSSRKVVIALCILLCAAIACDLGGSSGSGGSGEEAAGAHLYFKIDGLVPVSDYEVDVIWYGEPINTTGSAGDTLTFNLQKAYQEQVNAQGEVIIDELVVSKRPGTWLFRVTANGWSGECQQDLIAGQTLNINFKYQVAGCSTQGFPGE